VLLDRETIFAPDTRGIGRGYRWGATTIQFPSGYFYLTSRRHRDGYSRASHIDIQNFIVRWCNFHRNVLSAHRRRQRDAWRVTNTRTSIYHYADFYCYVVVYTPQVLTLESATFLSSGWSVARHQVARHKFIKDCDLSLPPLKLNVSSSEKKQKIDTDIFEKILISYQCPRYYKCYKFNY
jgi:hypothetical protein